MNIRTQFLKFPIILVICLTGICFESQGQFFQNEKNTFITILEFDSLAVAQLDDLENEQFYYLQDSLSDKIEPLAKMHCKTIGKRHHRLDNQYESITEEALKLGINSLKVDSSKVDGVTCEYWLSLYTMNQDQIDINESIVGDNLLCVFGKFDDQNKLGNSFKINGRKIKLMPYEYIKRNIAIGKRGSVYINKTRLELLGAEKGGELFINASSKPYLNMSLNLNVGVTFGAIGMLASIPLSSGNNRKVNGIERNFSYFLYNIYTEKIVIAKTRAAMIAEKKKEWREKNAAQKDKKK